MAFEIDGVRVAMERTFVMGDLLSLSAPRLEATEDAWVRIRRAFAPPEKTHVGTFLGGAWWDGIDVYVVEALPVPWRLVAWDGTVLAQAESGPS